MSTQTAKTPARVIRDGALKITVWENEGEKGTFFTAAITKTYRKDEALHDGHNFSGTDLLQIAELAKQAYAEINSLRREQTKNSEPSKNEERRNLAEHYPG